MPIVKVDGLPPEYRVEVDHSGKRWALLQPEMDYIHRVAEWDHLPKLEECLRAICGDERR